MALRELGSPGTSTVKQGKNATGYKNRSTKLASQALAQRLRPIENPGQAYNAQTIGQNPTMTSRAPQQAARSDMNSRIPSTMGKHQRPDYRDGTQGANRQRGTGGGVRRVGDAHTREAYQEQNPYWQREGMVLRNTEGPSGPTMARPDWMPGPVDPRDPNQMREALDRSLGGRDRPLGGLRRDVRDAQQGRLPQMHSKYQSSAQAAQSAQEQGTNLLGMVQDLFRDFQGANQGGSSDSGAATGSAQGLTANTGGDTATAGSGGQQQSQGGGSESNQQSGGGVSGYGQGRGRDDAGEQNPETFTGDTDTRPDAFTGKRPGGKPTLDDDWEGLAKDLGTDAGFVEYLAKQGFNFYRNNDGSVEWFHPSEDGWHSGQDAGDFTDEFEGGDEIGMHWQNYQQEVKLNEQQAAEETARNERMAAQQKIWDELAKAEEMDFSNLHDAYDRMKTAMEAQYAKHRGHGVEAGMERMSRGNLPTGASTAALSDIASQYDIAQEARSGELDVNRENAIIQTKMRNADKRYQAAMAMWAGAQSREEKEQAYRMALEAQREGRRWEQYVHERDKPGIGDYILGGLGAIAGPAITLATGGAGGAAAAGAGAATGLSRAGQNILNGAGYGDF